mgnify:CR=1 FL=1
MLSARVVLGPGGATGADRTDWRHSGEFGGARTVNLASRDQPNAFRLFGALCRSLQPGTHFVPFTKDNVLQVGGWRCAWGPWVQAHALRMFSSCTSGVLASHLLRDQPACELQKG